MKAKAVEIPLDDNHPPHLLSRTACQMHPIQHIGLRVKRGFG
jgi:hypothetical protein